MDTATIPEIKLAKVGKDKEERKKGGAAWLGEGAGKGVFTGATGGAGSGSSVLSFLESVLGRQLAMLLPKLLVMAMIGVLGFGAVSVGRAVRAMGESKGKGAAPKKAFATKAKDSDASVMVESQGRAPQDSLNNVVGSLDGKTQAERDAEAAAAAAAAAKANAADAAGKGGPADAAPAAAAAGPAGIDPAAMMAAGSAAAGAAGKAEGTKKASFGGMNMGGTGSTGGTGGLSATGLAHGIANNSSLGGNLRKFSSDGRTGRANAALARPGGFGRGAGFRQLANASNLSAAARNSATPETASTLATNAFQQGTNPGNVVTGAGDGTGGAGATGSSGANGGGGSGGGGGGQQQPTYGGTGNSAPTPDMCDTIFPNGGFVGSAGGGCVCPPGQDSNGSTCTAVKAKNMTPGQPLEKAAQTLLKIAEVMLMISMIIATIYWALYGAQVAPWVAALLRFLQGINAYIAGIATMLAGVCTLMGASLIAMGGEAGKNGAQLTAVSAAVTGLGLAALYSTWTPAQLPYVAAGIGVLDGICMAATPGM